MFIFSPKVYSMTIFNENESKNIIKIKGVQMDVTNSE